MYVDFVLVGAFVFSTGFFSCTLYCMYQPTDKDLKLKIEKIYGATNIFKSSCFLFGKVNGAYATLNTGDGQTTNKRTRLEITFMQPTELEGGVPNSLLQWSQTIKAAWNIMDTSRVHGNAGDV